jgi:hypothetical protein
MKGNRFTIMTLCLLSLAAGASDKVHFTDITAAAGIKFTTAQAAAEEMAAGNHGPRLRFFDADGDGWLDIIFINGKDLIPLP